MINFKKLLQERNVSILTLSNVLNISYASLHAIINQDVKIEDCKFSTVQKLSVFFRIDLNDMYLEPETFQTFRNNLHHQIKDRELEWYNNMMQHDLIHKYLLHEENEKAVYLMALLQYVERKYYLEPSALTNQYKNYALMHPFKIKSIVFENDSEHYIKEFEERNILEGDLYDAI